MTASKILSVLLQKKKQQYRQNQGVHKPIYRGLAPSATKTTLLRSLGGVEVGIFYIGFGWFLSLFLLKLGWNSGENVFFHFQGRCVL